MNRPIKVGIEAMTAVEQYVKDNTQTQRMMFIITLNEVLQSLGSKIEFRLSETNTAEFLLANDVPLWP